MSRDEWQYLWHEYRFRRWQSGHIAAIAWVRHWSWSNAELIIRVTGIYRRAALTGYIPDNIHPNLP